MLIEIKKSYLYLLTILIVTIGFAVAQTPSVFHSPAEVFPQGSGSGLDSDKVDGRDADFFIPQTDATNTPQGGKLLRLDSTGKFPTSAIPGGTGGSGGNAESVDGFSASLIPTANILLALDSNGKFPLDAMPNGVGSGGIGLCNIRTGSQSGYSFAACQSGEILTGGGYQGLSGTTNIYENCPKSSASGGCSSSGATGWGTIANNAVTAYAVCCTAGSSGGTSANAESVDGFSASATPTAGSLLALDSSGKFPASVIPDSSSGLGGSLGIVYLNPEATIINAYTGASTTQGSIPSSIPAEATSLILAIDVHTHDSGTTASGVNSEVSISHSDNSNLRLVSGGAVGTWVGGGGQRDFTEIFYPKPSDGVIKAHVIRGGSIASGVVTVRVIGYVTGSGSSSSSATSAIPFEVYAKQNTQAGSYTCISECSARGRECAFSIMGSNGITNGQDSIKACDYTSTSSTMTRSCACWPQGSSSSSGSAGSSGFSSCTTRFGNSANVACNSGETLTGGGCGAPGGLSCPSPSPSTCIGQNGQATGWYCSAGLAYAICCY